jgi:hypothetical protein
MSRIIQESSVAANGGLDEEDYGKHVLMDQFHSIQA